MDILAEVRKCYQCGKCSSGCEMNRLDPPFRPHRFIRFVVLGEMERAVRDQGLWKCTTCFTCSDGCPQDIPVADVLWALRAAATQSGCASAVTGVQREAFLSVGRLHSIDNKKRAKAALPALPERSDAAARIFALLEKERV